MPPLGVEGMTEMLLCGRLICAPPWADELGAAIWVSVYWAAPC